LERISRTTCSIFLEQHAGGASSNSRCASSKKKHELRLVRIADLREVDSNSSRQQPQQEGRVELRARHQFVGGEDVDDAAALGRPRDEIA
jgi:hypothetical protein